MQVFVPSRGIQPNFFVVAEVHIHVWCFRFVLEGFQSHVQEASDPVKEDKTRLHAI
jgi:hypothetical protein